jgi:pyruvate formate lyase activating enzyme
MEKQAIYFISIENKKVKCTLCPHNCVIKNEEIGICRVRKNKNGTLISLNFSYLSSIHTDPIEKKPMYHFYPGKMILSIGSVGCNLRCDFCQNSSISQIGVEEFNKGQYTSVNYIVNEAKRTRNNLGIAYTYNEPVVWYEFMIETAVKIRNEGMKNVMVSNGYINKEPLLELIPYIDAFNIDLKAYTENFYKKYTKSSLSPVLETIETIYKQGKHLEITNLIIPEIFEEMIKTIVSISGENAVLHLSRYFPAYKMTKPPTTPEKIDELYSIAGKYLKYVYIGNLQSEKGQNTYCPNCKNRVIARSLTYTHITGLKNGNCEKCSTEIPVII